VAVAAIAREAGFRWAQPAAFMGAFAVLATYFILHDLFLFANSTLYPSCFADTLRYTTSIRDYTACGPEAAIGTGQAIPPVPALTLSALQILLGALLWWKTGFKWLFIGSVVVLGLFSIPYSTTGGIFGNLGEPIISGLLIYTAAWVTRNQSSASLSPTTRRGPGGTSDSR